MKTFKEYITENYNNKVFEKVEKWKQNWISDIEKHQKIGDIVPTNEILEYVTSFHTRDSFDDSDFYERIMNLEYFKYEWVDMNYTLAKD